MARGGRGWAKCSPVLPEEGEQMVGSGLSLPGRLAVKHWQQAGAKEAQSISAQSGGCSLTHAFADHFLYSTEEEMRTRRQ